MISMDAYLINMDHCYACRCFLLRTHEQCALSKYADHAYIRDHQGTHSGQLKQSNRKRVKGRYEVRSWKEGESEPYKNIFRGGHSRLEAERPSYE